MLNENAAVPVGSNSEVPHKYQTIRAVVTRADGTVENRGIVSFSHRNPIINLIGAPLARFNGWAWERYYRLKRRFS